jgi:hypothetical protein
VALIEGNMGLAEGIRKLGFNRWHERELIHCHGWLVVALLCAVIAFAAFESLLQHQTLSAQVSRGLIALVAGAATVWALPRFLAGLVRAQQASSQATCAECGTFGRLAVVTEGRDADWVKVCCRQCSHEWVIEDGPGSTR